MIPPQSLCVSTQMGGITGGYKILILSTQVKQGKVHRILITPLQSHSKLHWKIPMFSLQCFHQNGWNHRGVKFFNPSTQFYYPQGWEGNWKNPRAVLYVYLCCWQSWYWVKWMSTADYGFRHSSNGKWYYCYCLLTELIPLSISSVDS